MLDIIRHPLGKPLLEALAASTDKLAAILKLDPSKAATPEETKALAEAQFNCVHLIRALCKLLPSWLPRDLYELLLQRWRTAERAERAKFSIEAPQPRDEILESKRLAYCLLNFIRRNHEEYPAIFDLVTIFGSNTGVDFSFLKSYISGDLARDFNIEEKRNLLKHWIKLYKDTGVSDEDKVNTLKYLINPMVLWTVTHGQHEIFSADLVKSLVSDVFVQFSQSAESGTLNEHLQVEVVQLCGSIIQHAHSYFVDQKKEIIAFIWWTLKHDSIAQPYGYLCVAHFFQAFPNVGETVMMKAFVNMVRLTTHDAASRDAIRQAVDITIPTLAATSERAAGEGK